MAAVAWMNEVEAAIPGMLEDANQVEVFGDKEVGYLLHRMVLLNLKLAERIAEMEGTVTGLQVDRVAVALAAPEVQAALAAVPLASLRAAVRGGVR